MPEDKLDATHHCPAGRSCVPKSPRTGWANWRNSSESPAARREAGRAVRLGACGRYGRHAHQLGARDLPTEKEQKGGANHDLDTLVRIQFPADRSMVLIYQTKPGCVRKLDRFPRRQTMDQRRGTLARFRTRIGSFRRCSHPLDAAANATGHRGGTEFGGSRRLAARIGLHLRQIRSRGPRKRGASHHPAPVPDRERCPLASAVLSADEATEISMELAASAIKARARAVVSEEGQ